MHVLYDASDPQEETPAPTWSSDCAWGAIGVIVNAAAGTPTATITNVSDPTLTNGQTGVVITGTNFGESGVIKISPTNNVNDVNAVTQGGVVWTSDTSLSFTATLGSLAADGSIRYLFVVPDGIEANASGAEVLFYNSPQTLTETISAILDSATGTRIPYVPPERRVYVNTSTGSASPSDPTNPGDAYDSLATAAAAEAADLTAAQHRLVIECSGGEDALSAQIVINAAAGWVTSADYPLEIYVASGSRHNGAQNSGYRLTASFDYAPMLTIATSYCSIRYLSMQNGGIASNNTRCLDFVSGAAVGTLEGCLLVSPARPLTGAVSGSYRAINCIFIGTGAALTGVGVAYTTAGVWTFDHCIAVAYGDSNGFYDNGVSTITCRNCFGRSPGATSDAFVNVTTINCAANDNSVSSPLNNVLYTTATFESVTQGAENFRLKPGAVLVDAGVTISDVTDDLLNVSRVGVTPDIGPFEREGAVVPEFVDHTIVRVFRSITFSN